MDELDETAPETGHLDSGDQPTEPDGGWAIPREYDVAGPTYAGRAAGAADEAPSPPAPDPGSPPSPDPGPPPRERTSRTLALWLGAAAALVLAAGLAAWLAVGGSPDPEPSAAHAARTPPVAETSPARTGITTASGGSSDAATTRIPVPDVRSMGLQSARAALEEAGLRVRIERVHASRAADTLLRESPDAGIRLARSAQVTLVVSAGPSLTPVPDVVGAVAENALRRLRAAGLVARVSLVASSRPAGTVLSQDPHPHGHVRPHSAVRVWVAKAVKPARVVVPDVVGRSVGAAEDELRKLGLRSSVEKTTSSQPSGTVVDQSPVGGASTRAHGVVTLTVSSGAPSVTVPDVTGFDEASARQELTAAGLQAVVSYEDGVDPSEDGIVLDQSPGPEKSAPSGSTVLLTVGRSS